MIGLLDCRLIDRHLPGHVILTLTAGMAAPFENSRS